MYEKDSCLEFRYNSPRQKYSKSIGTSNKNRKYTSFDFEKMCVENGIIHSYSAKGTPLDNAPIESFHANLKKKEVYAKIYSSFEHAKQSLFRYIEGFYNTHRVHSSLNYLSPRDFEKQYYKQIS